MEKLIKIESEDNMNIYIEAHNVSDLQDTKSISVPVASEKKIVKKSIDFLDNSLSQISNFSNCIAEKLKSTALQPDEFEVEFAVKFTADAGIVISSIGMESNINVKLKWEKNKGE